LVKLERKLEFETCIHPSFQRPSVDIIFLKSGN